MMTADPSRLHDAGGKARLKLPADVTGSAEWSEDGKHRFVLWRRWNPGGSYLLWIGMNPSVADATAIDDPTVRREWQRTRLMGHDAFAKANVMSLRATDPKKLLDGDPVREDNLSAIRRLAKSAAGVVAAWGSLPGKLQVHADETEAALRADGHDLLCLGTTKSGAPRHPLYVAGATSLIPYLAR